MNISWLHEDLEVFENSFDLTISLVFTLARFITLILAIIVHRTFYKLMQRLPGRAVNQIIYPYMVSCQKTIFTGSALGILQMLLLLFASFVSPGLEPKRACSLSIFEKMVRPCNTFSCNKRKNNPPLQHFFM